MKCELHHYNEPPDAEIVASLALAPPPNKFSGEVLSYQMCRDHGNDLAVMVLTAGWLYETWRAETMLPADYHD